jgi:hypothetical protein
MKSTKQLQCACGRPPRATPNCCFTSAPASGVCREKNLNETGWWGEHPMARSHCQPYGANMTTLLIIVLLLALFGGGGGYYYSRRRR